jgi:hypothetical protein
VPQVVWVARNIRQQFPILIFPIADSVMSHLKSWPLTLRYIVVGLQLAALEILCLSLDLSAGACVACPGARLKSLGVSPSWEHPSTNDLGKLMNKYSAPLPPGQAGISHGLPGISSGDKFQAPSMVTSLITSHDDLPFLSCLMSLPVCFLGSCPNQP